MKKTITFSLLILTTLLLFACSLLPHIPGASGKSHFPEEYQVKNQTDQTVSSFGLNIAPAGEMGDWVVDWLSDVTEKEGFQYFIYADPDSWDVYLYYPIKQAEIQMLKNDDIAVEYSDHILHVYVTSPHPEENSVHEEEKWILHFMAPTVGAWPANIRLYWDGSEILCDSAAMNQ